MKKQLIFLVSFILLAITGCQDEPQYPIIFLDPQIEITQTPLDSGQGMPEFNITISMNPYSSTSELISKFETDVYMWGAVFVQRIRLQEEDGDCMIEQTNAVTNVYNISHSNVKNQLIFKHTWKFDPQGNNWKNWYWRSVDFTEPSFKKFIIGDEITLIIPKLDLRFEFNGIVQNYELYYHNTFILE